MTALADKGARPLARQALQAYLSMIVAVIETIYFQRPATPIIEAH